MQAWSTRPSPTFPAASTARASTIEEPEDGVDKRCMHVFNPSKGLKDNHARLAIGCPRAEPTLGEVVERLAREPELVPVRIYMRGVLIPPEDWSSQRLDLRESAPLAHSHIVALQAARESMQVFVQTIISTLREEFIVDKNDPVVLLTALVRSRYDFGLGLRPNNVRFTDARGKELSTGDTFAQSNIQEGSTVSLHIRMVSGPMECEEVEVF